VIDLATAQCAEVPCGLGNASVVLVESITNFIVREQIGLDMLCYADFLLVSPS